MPNTITAFTTFTAATKAKSEEVNANFSNFRGTILPINENTITASNNTHDLGSTDHNFRRAHISGGYFGAGMIMPLHDYNGALSIPQGWMKCDGRQVTEANYDAEHNAGDWDIYIVTSDLENLYLPDLTDNIYLTGATTTTEGGTAAVALVGATNNAVDLVHNHSHNHVWYDETNDGTNSLGRLYTATGLATATMTGSKYNCEAGIALGWGSTGCIGYAGSSDNNFYTDTDATNGGNSATSIQPRSLEVMYYMRII